MRKTPVILLSLAVVGGVAAAMPAVANANTAQRAAIANSHPSWATPNAKTADANGQSKLTFRVYLTMRDLSGAEAAAKAVSDPSSPSYHKYLTPAQVKAQYAPDAGEVNSVRGWLSSSGFSIGKLPANDAYVEATGTVDQVQQAFGTHLSEYRVAGRQLRAADGSLTVPASVRNQVSSIVGVNQNYLRPSHTTGATTPSQAQPRAKSSNPNTVAPPAGFRNAQPCSAYYGQKVDTTDPAYKGKQYSYAPCGYKPQQLRSAYGISNPVASGTNGKGVRVAIVDAFASPTIYEDASEYAKRNDPQYPLKTNQFKQIVFPPTPGSEAPDQCDAAGWYGEETLDVEAVHGMAPGANILFVGASDCSDSSLDTAVNEVVANHEADIISNSYGDTGEDVAADEVQAFENIAIQAAMEGIGLYFSSGDSGDENAALGHPAADFSASSPWVTAVGGTSLGIDAKGHQVLQTGWETTKATLTNGKWTENGYVYGSGGGTSVLFQEPYYQQGVVPDKLAKENQTGSTRGRVVPDISALGDPNTGFLVGETQTFPDGVYYDQYRIGGTSLACPLTAGIMADADQLDGVHHGFINPTLYTATRSEGGLLDVKPVPGAVVRSDYTNGVDSSGGLTTSVRNFDYQGLTINTTPGYDNVTGLGAPFGTRFLKLS
ncbi:MAG: S8/S53 family peptidase [Sciscionella sp.]|nr:S8/S53 family peptidase [Sciscionella sp.]